MESTTKRSALDFFPGKINLQSLEQAAETCKGCDLYKMATQTVFGEGPKDAEVMMIGEVPGDEEDQTGHPFVGPAGRLLNKALEEAGIDRSKVYTTNVVKHFKWKQSGKRRLHEKPKASEIAACRPWLDAEIEVIRPRILILLGATAAQALLGRDFRVTKMHGQWIPSELAEKVLATVHPSSILRAPDPEMRQKQYLEFVADLLVAAKELGRSGRKARHQTV
jgi:uracil-DNA glycosylase family protein